MSAPLADSRQLEISYCVCVCVLLQWWWQATIVLIILSLYTVNKQMFYCLHVAIFHLRSSYISDDDDDDNINNNCSLIW